MKNLILFLLLFSAFAIKAQPYSTQNKKAIELYEEAKRKYLLTEYDNALKPCNQAIKKDSSFVEAYYMMAAIYKAKNLPNDDISYLKVCANRNGRLYPKAYFLLAQEQLDYGMYEDASQTIEILMQFKQVFNTHDLESITLVKEKIDFCNYQVKHPIPFNPINMGAEINSQFDDYEPALTADGEEIIITCLLPISQNMQYAGGNSVQEDFFIAKKENGKWAKRVDLGMPINTPGNEGAQSISADGRIFFYTACSRMDSKGSCDIYYSIRKGGQWSNPRNLGNPVNTSYWESQPSCSADGRIVYYASNRPGGYGQMDLWETHIDGQGKWTAPKNLGPNINTIENEQSPFIHADGRTLYFASAGHLGMGKMDIFKSEKDSLGNWGKPINIGYPINTWKDESDFRVSANGNTAIISSNRDGGFGGADLYTFELYKEARPREVSYVKGNIFDAKTQKKLGAMFELIDLKNGDIVMTSFSDAVSGQFLVPLALNNEYALNVSKDGYMFYSEHYNLQQDSSMKPMELNIPLQPIEAGGTVVLENVFFDTDKFQLKNESRVELQRLIEFMNFNKEVKIQISGHTDNTGDKQKNITLSDNRAKAVTEYLISKGIAKERLTYKGYGDSKPLAPNDSEKNKAMNRRTEFMIL